MRDESVSAVLPGEEEAASRSEKANDECRGGVAAVHAEVDATEDDISAGNEGPGEATETPKADGMGNTPMEVTAEDMAAKAPEHSGPATERLLKIHTTLGELTSSPHIHDVIELALAAATSLSLCASEEHPALVWLLVIANPSSGKTEAVLTLKDLEARVYYVDSLTENAFLSGFVDKHGNAPKKQLLEELDGKCLIIKDLTTLFSANEEKVKKVLGELASIYDGEYSKATGTLGCLRVKSKFPILACITPQAIRKHQNYMSLIGGRFLMIQLAPLTEDQQQEGFERLDDEAGRKHNLSRLKQLVGEHANALFQPPFLLEPESKEQRKCLRRLAQLLARGRGVVMTEKVRELNEETGEERYSYQIMDVQIEEPFRAFQQLRTLGRNLARVHGRTAMTDHELEVLRRVVWSSMPPTRHQVLSLYRESPVGLNQTEACEKLGKSLTTTRNLLNELVELNLLRVAKVQSVLVYAPVPDLADLISKPLVALDHIADLALG